MEGYALRACTLAPRTQDCIDISLSELQKTLDAQCIELVENQKESVVGRKALADRTKGEFSARGTSSTLQLHSSQSSRKVRMSRS